LWNTRVNREKLMAVAALAIIVCEAEAVPELSHPLISLK
jgi:hypothetical protein